MKKRNENEAPLKKIHPGWFLPLFPLGKQPTSNGNDYRKTIPTDEARRDFQNLIENNQLDPSFGNFKIINTITDEFIGLAKLEIKEGIDDRAELGYMLLPEYWGIGIGGIVAKQLTDLAKAHNSIKSLFAIIDPKNIPSRKILVNNGFISREFKDFDGLLGEVLELYLAKD